MVGGWRQLVVGGWRLVAVDGWRLAVGSVRGWWRWRWRLVRLAAGGWWSLGAVQKGCPERKKRFLNDSPGPQTPPRVWCEPATKQSPALNYRIIFLVCCAGDFRLSLVTFLASKSTVDLATRGAADGPLGRGFPKRRPSWPSNFSAKHLLTGCASAQRRAASKGSPLLNPAPV